MFFKPNDAAYQFTIYNLPLIIIFISSDFSDRK